MEEANSLLQFLQEKKDKLPKEELEYYESRLEELLEEKQENQYRKRKTTKSEIDFQYKKLDLKLEPKKTSISIHEIDDIMLYQELVLKRHDFSIIRSAIRLVRILIEKRYSKQNIYNFVMTLPVFDYLRKTQFEGTVRSVFSSIWDEAKKSPLKIENIDCKACYRKMMKLNEINMMIVYTCEEYKKTGKCKKSYFF